jgi:hypothetical protein
MAGAAFLHNGRETEHPAGDDVRGPRKPRTEALLQEGWRLLAAGRGSEAGDVFGRVLLLDPRHAEARRGLARARRATAEEHRGLDARIDEALGALGAGDGERARALLEEVVARGGDRDRALALLDRLAPHRGRIEASAPPPAAPERERPGAAARGATLPWRRALVTAWAVALALLTAGLVLGWDRLLAELTRAPAPSRAGSALR